MTRHTTRHTSRHTTRHAALRTPRAFALLTVLSLLAAVPTGLPEAMSASGADITDEDVGGLGLAWENARAHNATLWCVRWSPDGSMIAATYFDNTTIVFDSQGGDILAELGPHAGPGAAWSGASGGTTRCDGGQDCGIDRPDHWPGRVCAFSPDGRYIATGGDNLKAIVYSTADWSVHRVLGGHLGSILAMDWSPDSRLLLTGTGTDKVDFHNLAENTLRVWDVENSTVVDTVTGYRDAILALRYSPNGSWVATASDDKTVKIIDTATWDVLYSMGGHVNGVLDVGWSPDGETLVSGSRDYKARTWYALNGTPKDRWEDANCVRSVDWHPDGVLVATSGVEEALCKIRNGTTGDVLLTLDEAGETRSVVMSSRWSPDGKRLASGAGKEKTLRVYGFGEGSTGGGGEGGLPDWLGGACLIILIAAAGTFLLYYPLRKKLREAGR